MKISATGIAWFKREDYDAALRIFSDSDKLPRTYDEWFEKAENLVDHLRGEGHTVEKVYIDPDTFPAWCAARGLNVDAKARMRFGSEAVARQHMNKNSQ